MIQSTPLPADLYAFEPSAERAHFLDQRTRLRLADSLSYISAQADGQLAVPPESFAQFISRLKLGPVSPLAFSFYCDLVLAIEGDDLEQASQLCSDLIRLPAHSGITNISELADPSHDATAQRYIRFINTDEAIEFEVSPPSPANAAQCRAEIQAAFTLMQAGDPALAGEIRGLLREIILAAGTQDPKAMTFDGVSSFMLWGAIILNANRREGELSMVQKLAHESAHNLLFGFSADGSLVENDDDELFSSPLRPDPRPMDGIYHATFVTARMHRVIKRLVESGVLSAAQKESARKELDDNARLFQNGIATVNQQGKLTSLGKVVMQGASDYMAANA